MNIIGGNFDGYINNENSTFVLYCIERREDVAKFIEYVLRNKKKYVLALLYFDSDIENLTEDVIKLTTVNRVIKIANKSAIYLGEMNPYLKFTIDMYMFNSPRRVNILGGRNCGKHLLRRNLLRHFDNYKFTFGECNASFDLRILVCRDKIYYRHGTLLFINGDEEIPNNFDGNVIVMDLMRNIDISHYILRAIMGERVRVKL